MESLGLSSSAVPPRPCSYPFPFSFMTWSELPLAGFDISTGQRLLPVGIYVCAFLVYLAFASAAPTHRRMNATPPPPNKRYRTPSRSAPYFRSRRSYPPPQPPRRPRAPAPRLPAPCWRGPSPTTTSLLGPCRWGRRRAGRRRCRVGAPAPGRRRRATSRRRSVAGLMLNTHGAASGCKVLLA